MILMRQIFNFTCLLLIFTACNSDDDNNSPTDKENNGFFILNNLNSESQIVYFKRNEKEGLYQVGTFGTKGKGQNLSDNDGPFNPLLNPNFSQDAIVFNEDKTVLFAVNNGEQSISSFKIHDASLEFIEKIETGYDSPTSLAFEKGKLYVLHFEGGLVGFDFNNENRLTPIQNTSHQFDPALKPFVNVSINKAANKLFVTTIRDRAYVISLTADGTYEDMKEADFSGKRPFGASFLKDDIISVSEALFGVSTYKILSDNSITPLSEIDFSIIAFCWIVPDANMEYVYASNTLQGRVYSFENNEGMIKSTEQVYGNNPPSRNQLNGGLDDGTTYFILDVVVTDNYVYTVDPLNERIDAYQRIEDGGLEYDENESYFDWPIIEGVTGGFNGFDKD